MPAEYTGKAGPNCDECGCGAWEMQMAGACDGRGCMWGIKPYAVPVGCGRHELFGLPQRAL
eukprot:2595736-Prymnesium_polylepis.1